MGKKKFENPASAPSPAPSEAVDELPEQCNYLSLGAARIKEIHAILTKFDAFKHGGRVFQHQPRHMQRRAVSANPKRLAKSLRERHNQEANYRPTFRPRRKYRRRPKNLLLEYNRRQKEHIWLETHIWHAKRFHMTRHWGYALSLNPTCKGYRALLRAAKKSCQLQDISFMCCIELEGSKDSLLNGLSNIIQASSLPCLEDIEIQSGVRSIEVMLFQLSRQPYGAIGAAEMLWHPPSYLLHGKSRVWLWVHPAVHSQVVDVLTKVFDLVKSDSAESCPNSSEYKIEVIEESYIAEEMTSETEEEGTEDDNKGNQSCPKLSEDKVEGIESYIAEEMTSETKEEGREDDNKGNQSSKQNQKQPEQSSKQNKLKSNMPKNVNEAKLATRNVPFDRTPKYTSDSTKVTMTLLKDTLNRFRLTGLLSHSIISSALHPASIAVRLEKVDDDGKSEQPWWSYYYTEERNKSNHLAQVKAWKQLPSCSQPSSGTVLPLVIRDPRVTLPQKKIPMETAIPEITSKEPDKWPVESPLYDSDFRDEITLSKEPDSFINKDRRQLLVPGSKLPETANESCLPLLLIARGPTYTDEFGNGWDIIIPSGWAMSVWMPLIYCGAVPGGQRNAEALHLEIHTPFPPHFLPDTPAGDSYSKWLNNERQVDFFKRPPSRRNNFIKLGVQFPFISPWRKLAQDWEPGTEDIYALRDPKLLQALVQLSKETPYSVSMGTKQVNDVHEPPCKKIKTEDMAVDICNIEMKLQGLSYGCLVMVKLELCYKGVVEPCAIICLPLEEDLQDREKPRKPSSKVDICEPSHHDPKAQHRIKLKEEHHKIKCRMQRQRRKARQKASVNVDILPLAKDKAIEQATAEALKKVENENKDILDRYSSFHGEMKNAWLMDTCDPLQRCSRKIFGYVTHGAFCQTLGKGAGIGWVSLKPLLRLMRMGCGGSGTLKDEEGSNFGDNKRDGKSNDCLVLVRNTCSFEYRWAKLSVYIQQ